MLAVFLYALFSLARCHQMFVFPRSGLAQVDRHLASFGSLIHHQRIGTVRFVFDTTILGSWYRTKKTTCVTVRMLDCLSDYSEIICEGSLAQMGYSVNSESGFLLV